MNLPSPRLPFPVRRVVHQLSAAQATSNARRALERNHSEMVRVEGALRRFEPALRSSPDAA